jgi:hypothetical protein
MGNVNKPYFCSQSFLDFVCEQTLKSKVFCAETFFSEKNNLPSKKTDSEAVRINALHKRFSNNGKRLYIFEPGGYILTHDERLRLAVYQSTFRDSR